MKYDITQPWTEYVSLPSSKRSMEERNGYFCGIAEAISIVMLIIPSQICKEGHQSKGFEGK